MDEYEIREKDVDMSKVDKICRDHTSAELDAEWEEFKRLLLSQTDRPAQQ